MPNCGMSDHATVLVFVVCEPPMSWLVTFRLVGIKRQGYTSIHQANKPKNGATHAVTGLPQG